MPSSGIISSTGLRFSMDILEPKDTEFPARRRGFLIWFALQQDPILNENSTTAYQLDSSRVQQISRKRKKGKPPPPKKKKSKTGGNCKCSLCQLWGCRNWQSWFQLILTARASIFKFWLAILNTGRSIWTKPLISGNFWRCEITALICSFWESEILTQFLSIDLLSDRIKIKFPARNLIFRQKSMDCLPSSNSVTYSNSGNHFTDMGLRRYSKGRAYGWVRRVRKPHLAAVFDGFRLEKSDEFF